MTISHHGWTLKKYPELIGEMIFSNESVDSFGDATPEVLPKIEENPACSAAGEEGTLCFRQ